MIDKITLTGTVLLTLHFLFGKHYPLLHVIPLLFLIAGLILFEKKKFFIPKHSEPIIIIYLTILFIGYFSAVENTHNYIFPLQNAMRYLSYLIFFLFIFNSKFKSIHLIYIILFILLLSTIMLIFQTMCLHIGRPYAMFIHANHYAYFLSFSSIILTANSSNYLKSIFFIVIIGTLILATRSLGGLIVFFIGFYLYIRSSAGKWKYLVMLVLILSIPVAMHFHNDRIKQLSDLKTLSDRIEDKNPGGGSSLRWRIVYWYMIVDNTIKNRNVLLGNGLGTASSGSPIAIEVLSTDPHNDYVRIFAETGLIGLALYLSLYYFILRYLLKIKKNCLYFCHKRLWSHYNSVYAIVIALMVAQISGNLIVSSAVIWMICAYSAVFLRNVSPPLNFRGSQVI